MATYFTSGNVSFHVTRSIHQGGKLLNKILFKAICFSLGQVLAVFFELPSFSELSRDHREMYLIWKRAKELKNICQPCYESCLPQALCWVSRYWSEHFGIYCAHCDPGFSCRGGAKVETDGAACGLLRERSRPISFRPCFGSVLPSPPSVSSWVNSWDYLPELSGSWTLRPNAETLHL